MDEQEKGKLIPAGGEKSLDQAIANANLPVCVNAGIKFKLFSAHFVAAVQKDEKALQVLLAPADAEENEGITIKQIVSEIRGLMGAKEGEKNPELEGMEKQLESTVGGMANKEAVDLDKAFDPMAIRVFIRQAFVYYRKEAGEGAKSSLEYAFSLQIDQSKMLKKMEVFELNGITLAVWKTNRMKVKEKMKMFDIDQYLKELA